MDLLENEPSVIPRTSHPRPFAKGGQIERADSEVATFASSTRTHGTGATHATVEFRSMDFVPYHAATLSSREVEAHAVSVNNYIEEEDDEEDSFPPNYRELEDTSPPEYRNARASV
jgi:hypothetical protein